MCNTLQSAPWTILSSHKALEIRVFYHFVSNTLTGYYLLLEDE